MGEGAEVTLSIKSLKMWSGDLHTDNDDIDENDINNNKVWRKPHFDSSNGPKTNGSYLKNI